MELVSRDRAREVLTELVNARPQMGKTHGTCAPAPRQCTPWHPPAVPAYATLLRPRPGPEDGEDLVGARDPGLDEPRLLRLTASQFGHRAKHEKPGERFLVAVMFEVLKRGLAPELVVPGDHFTTRGAFFDATVSHLLPLLQVECTVSQEVVYGASQDRSHYTKRS